MSIASVNSISRVLGLSRLMGPIFSKELRVSSRRRRNYILRSVYLIFLTVFLTMIWLDVVNFTRVSGTYVVSRMAQAGKQIIVTLVWFQFYATQIVAVVMLSTAISDEIYHRTLGVLMTTPVTSLQIVMGKLSGKLLQLVLLLAASLPVLAVVRVFGGVPWEYVLSSLCMTLTALVFVGSLSLFFSTFSSKAYVVIIVTLAALGLLFGFPLFLITGQLGRGSWHSSARSFPFMDGSDARPKADRESSVLLADSLRDHADGLGSRSVEVCLPCAKGRPRAGGSPAQRAGSAATFLDSQVHPQNRHRSDKRSHPASQGSSGCLERVGVPNIQPGKTHRRGGHRLGGRDDRRNVSFSRYCQLFRLRRDSHAIRLDIHGYGDVLRNCTTIHLYHVGEGESFLAAFVDDNVERLADRAR
ncbi:MAG: ABC transporter permease [Sedimentisphaerales bacterium]